MDTMSWDCLKILRGVLVLSSFFKCFFFFFLIHLIGNHLTDVRTGANGAFILNKVEINSEILNNRGKITISIENKGRNTNLPS